MQQSNVLLRAVVLQDGFLMPQRNFKLALRLVMGYRIAIHLKDLFLPETATSSIGILRERPCMQHTFFASTKKSNDSGQAITLLPRLQALALPEELAEPAMNQLNMPADTFHQ